MSDKTAIISKAFPSYLADDVHIILDKIPLNSSIGPQGILTALLHGESIQIPQRIYYVPPDPSFIRTLTPLQSNILRCLFTRHHDGYLREDYLRQIFSSDCNNIWIVPYVMQLLGEYVIEILQVIDDNIDLIDTQIIKNFVNDNPCFIQITKSRVTSYWNEYYRRQYPKKEDYVGFRILDYVDEIARGER